MKKGFPPSPVACPAGCVTSVSQRCLAGAGGAAAAPLAQGAVNLELGFGMEGMEMRSGFLTACV